MQNESNIISLHLPDLLPTDSIVNNKYVPHLRVSELGIRHTPGRLYVSKLRDR